MSKLENAKRTLAEAEARMDEAADALENADENISADDLAELEAEFDASSEEVARSKASVERYERIAEARNNTVSLPAPEIRVTKNEVTYREDGNHSYFGDLYTAGKGNSAAAERVAKHNAEMRTTGTSTDAAGVIFPQYLADQLVEVAREGRPFANVLPKLPLPASGETFKWPKVTTGASIDVQAAENDAPATAVFTVTNDDSDMVTIAGMVDVTRQSLERSDPALDALIAADLTRAYNQKLDYQLINGTGADGQHLGLRNVSSPNTVSFTGSDGAALLGKVYDAIQKVASNRFAQASAIVMHPRRAAWLAAARDTDTPLFQQGALMLTQGQQDRGFVGVFAGLPVVVDANVPTNLGASTNEDEIYVVRLEDMFLMEGGLRSANFEEVLSGTMGIRVAAWAYSVAALHRYPKSITIISGSGLATPSF